MAVPPADDGAGALTDRSSRTRVIVLGVLAVALVASAAVLAWLLLERRGGADDLQAERERIMAQSEQFMLRMGTFGPDLVEGDTMPQYRERVTEVITEKFAEEFREQVVAAEQLVIQQQAERDVEVFSTGVSSLDEDSATALVAGAFTNSVAGEAGEPFPFRLELDLVKVDGEWLVDDFAPITGDEPPAVAPSPTTPPSAQPSAQPSEEPSGRPSDRPSRGRSPRPSGGATQ